jgi:hypothetical protein
LAATVREIEERLGTLRALALEQPGGYLTDSDTASSAETRDEADRRRL